MQKGRFNVKTFTPDQNMIEMDGWVEPTIVNTGTLKIYILGIPVEPGDSFILGPAGVAMVGNIEMYHDLNAAFLATDKIEAKVSYVTLDN